MSAKPRVLLIEDNEQNRYLLTYLLGHHGFDVAVFENGRKGLQALQDGATPALILLDIQLPEMDGYQIARAIKASPATASIPLVAVSSFAMPGDRAKALAIGFDGYIEKPIDPKRFAAQLEPFLRQP